MLCWGLHAMIKQVNYWTAGLLLQLYRQAEAIQRTITEPGLELLGLTNVHRTRTRKVGDPRAHRKSAQLSFTKSWRVPLSKLYAQP